MSEASMQRMEAFIPTLVLIAMQRARWHALAMGTKRFRAGRATPL